MSKLLILGSRGLIGSACKRIFSSSHDLLCPTRQELDLLNREQSRLYFEKHRPEFVILAAGIVGGIKYNTDFPADFLMKNLSIQMNVFDAAHQAQVKRLFFFASSCMYPKECPQPMKEEMLYTGHLEKTSMSYAVSKMAGVQMAAAFNQQYKTNRNVALLPNSVYGPNDNFNPETGHVMSALIRRFHDAKVANLPEVTLWGNGEPKREFIFADDVARAIDFILQHPEVPCPINIGVGFDISIKSLAEMIAQIVGFKGQIVWDIKKPLGTMRKFLDNGKILQMGWKPTVDLEKGIQITYQWFLQYESISKF
ncbi:MAG TPA: GDP-L-fucose synthase [Chlamydiales bacterium]|nr:GDP-L-fucose synthase [Chlamydiales bacterium]